MTDTQALPAYRHNDPIWFHEHHDSEPVPALFVKESKRRGIVIELAGNHQRHSNYACITRREVVEVDA